MKRKEFIQQMGAVAMLAAMGVTLESCEPEEAPTPDPGQNAKQISFDISTGDFAVLQNDDGWLLHPEEDILLVNIGGTISALTSVCTHTGCSRAWTYENTEFTCTCHGSKFSNQGAVTQGPARANLRKFAVVVDGDMVTVTV